jgi:hypothetical protein
MFRADKVGDTTQNLADVTLTKVTFGHVVFNVGGYFASNKWTPPAGIVSLTASFFATNIAAVNSNASGGVAIYKNGSIFSQTNGRQDSSSAFVATTISDTANGTDFYEMYVVCDSTGGNTPLQNDATITFFSGRSLEVGAVSLSKNRSYIIG